MIKVLPVNNGKDFPTPWHVTQRCYIISKNSVFSGFGAMDEYFHFLTDFVIPIHNGVNFAYPYAKARKECTIYYHDEYPYMYQRGSDRSINNCATGQPSGGWSYNNPFDLRNLGTMEEHYKIIFQDKLKFKQLSLDEEYMSSNPIGPKEIMLHPYNEQYLYSPGSWGRKPQVMYKNFKKDMLSRLPKDREPKSVDVLLIRRGQRKGMLGHGSARRYIDPIFYDDLTRMLSDKNITCRTVEFDNMELWEQIQHVMDCKVIVGQHGAGLTNMVFAADNTLIIEIGHQNYPCYEFMAASCGLSLINDSVYESVQFRTYDHILNHLK